VLVGLLGVVVFLGVDHRGWSWPVVFPLVTAVLVAVRDAVTRRMPVAVPSSTVATTTAIATALVGLATLPLGWLPLSGPLLLVLLVSSAVSGVAFYLYILATRLGELSYLAPFRFLGLPLGAVIGLVAWGDWPGVREWLGAALITGSGLFILRRERTLARSGR
jgi:drug/metabolite transporter (DMT)-like permease